MKSRVLKIKMKMRTKQKTGKIRYLSHIRHRQFRAYIYKAAAYAVIALAISAVVLIHVYL